MELLSATNCNTERRLLLLFCIKNALHYVENVLKLFTFLSEVISQTDFHKENNLSITFFTEYLKIQ